MQFIDCLYEFTYDRFTKESFKIVFRVLRLMYQIIHVYESHQVFIDCNDCDFTKLNSCDNDMRHITCSCFIIIGDVRWV